jgi:hypothetical protein
LWLAVVLIAWAVRPDLLGVTSFVRASFLQPRCYHLLLNFFHSNAVVLSLLLSAWVTLALKVFSPCIEHGYRIFVADGLKVAKEGKKMPAVKCLHQESVNNSKAEYIMGHSFQVVAMLATAATGQVFAIPLLARICEGLMWDRSSQKPSLLDKLANMFIDVVALAKVPALLVADAYYASRKVIEPLLDNGHQLISRVRKNAVAYELPCTPTQKKRGRPRKYGNKIRLANLFKAWQSFSEAHSPVYDEDTIIIKYRSVDLLWRPVGRLVRFVLVKHPKRGKLILIATDLDMDPLAIIKIYGLRFKIEVSFKQALHNLGAYAYHFWMRDMTPIRWRSGNQDLTWMSQRYKDAVKRKLSAYHRYVQIGCIVQGLLQHLAINFRYTVWAKFRSWLRTMKQNLVPSEMVVAQALRSDFPEFLLNKTFDAELKKFILDRADPHQLPGFKMTA